MNILSEKRLWGRENFAEKSLNFTISGGAFFKSHIFDDLIEFTILKKTEGNQGKKFAKQCILQAKSYKK